MDKFIEQVIEEKFVSRAQQGLFFAKAKHSKKWKDMADEFADKTDWSEKLPYKVKKQEEETTDQEVDEIVDSEGNFISGDAPGNPNAYITARKTTDQAAKAFMGSMGSFGVLGGAPGHYKTLKYWAEADMSKALGADEVLTDPDTDFKDAVKDFKKLDVPDDEAKERAKQMGYDPELDETGKMRLIEDPQKYIEEYLAKKAKPGELVRQSEMPEVKKELNPILLKQLNSIKQSLKNNGLKMTDIAEYLEDNE